MHILSYLTILSVPFVHSLSCKDEQGADVGNWVLLKFPQSTSYVYSNDTQPSPYSLNDTSNGALSHTMQQLWSLSSNEYVLYNDEPPFGLSYNFSVAHAKAVLMWEFASSSAVGIFHSIPKFPVGPEESPEYSGLLPNAFDYAQHVTCVTLSFQDLSDIVPALMTLSPQVYEGAFPTVSVDITESNSCSYQVIATEPQRILITKTADFEADIWSACVSDYFSTNLQVMSWIHGTMDGPITNQTIATITSDISKIVYPFGESYTEYENHGKWAIGESPLVCTGDMNRVESQKVRSGAALCWKDAALWNALSGVSY